MNKLVLSLLLLLPIVVSFANPIDESTAKTIALNFISSKVSVRNMGNDPLKLAYKAVENATTTCFYVFNLTNSKGFVIVSADDIVEPILGYSTESNYDTTAKHSLPIQMTEWLNIYSKKIVGAIQNKVIASEKVKRSWLELKNKPTFTHQMLLNTTSGIAPLVHTLWDQSPDFLTTGPYNKLCPFDKNYGSRTLTGCVATTMAQVMKYWNYPAKGNGSHSYTPGSYPYLGVQTANFANTTYHWDQMPDTLSAKDSPSQIDAITTLMYHCGVSINMDYGVGAVGGSGAYSINYGGALKNTAQDAMVNYFGYDKNIKGFQRSSYIEETWIGMLENELNASRPVIYTGSGTGGHCFVMDGYDNINLFHFNWGWSGDYNGYFNINDLTPGTDSFNLSQTALINIKPSVNVTPTVNTVDSLALIDFYNNTGGVNWTNKTWLKGPVSNWNGVTLDTFGRVSGILLPNNNLIGSIPNSIVNMGNLIKLDLNGNKLSGVLPLALSNINNLTLDVSNNNYTFAGIEPIAEKLLADSNNNFYYLPQSNVSIQQSGKKLWISVGGTPQNIKYVWFKNGTTISTKMGDSSYIPTSSGTYQVTAYDTALAYSYLLSSSLTVNGIYVQANTNDSLTLVDLYNNTGGVNWYNTSGWLQSAPLNSWYGVLLDTNGRVSSLNLSFNNLVDTLPFSLGNLKNLSTLNLYYNNLTGNIPLSASLNNKLSTINVSYNHYTFDILESLKKNFKGDSTLIIINSPQDTIIPIQQSGNKLWVSVGGTSNKIFYTWNLNGNKLITINGDSSYIPKFPGLYTVIAYDSLIGVSLRSTTDTVNIYVQPNSNDSLSLVDFYNNTGGINWTNKMNWLQSTPLSSWYGVTLDTAGKVSSLTLGTNNLKGSIPSSIGALSNLKTISLGYNNLSGSIPTSLGNLTELTYLNLTSNNLTGNIPITLSKLNTLQVSYNKFTFAGLESIVSKMRGDSMSYFSISPQDSTVPIIQTGNKLSFSVGGTPKNVTYRWYLNGSILTTIKGDSTYTPNASGIYTVNAYDSVLKFYIYSSRDTMNIYIKPNTDDSLALVDLYNSTNGINWKNKAGWLTSPVCNWHGVILDSTGRVATINQSSNNLVGNIPNSIGNLSNLNRLNIGTNLLSGIIPSSINKLNNLTYLNIANNNYNFSSFEPILQSLIGDSTLSFIYKPQKAFPIHQTGNQLSVSVGGTPNSISYYWSYNGIYLTTINGDSTFTCNQSGRYSVNAFDSILGMTLSSKIDTVTIYIKPNPIDSLAMVDLYDSTQGALWLHNTNWLTAAPLATWYGISLDSNGRINKIALYSDSLRGNIPYSLGNLSGLKYLGLNTNELTGNIPSTLGNLSNVEIFYLYGNQLTGTIPTSLGNLSNVRVLEVGQNKLTGTIPPSLGNLHNVDTLYLWGNQLTGTIPDTLSRLSNLISLSLSQNKLTGSIPSSFGNLSKLTTLVLSQNKLTGTIPTTLANLTSLSILELNSNQLTGIIPSEFGILSNLQYLYLNSNKLTGSIPSSLGSLSNLQYLLLNSNALSGNIPTELGNLSNLIYLYLYTNQLSGSIPTSLGNLTSLKILYLYGNRLTGNIPSSIGNLTSLQRMGLYSNQLSGSVPASITNLTNLTYLYLNNNKFTFDGMEMLAQAFPTATYYPQSSIHLHTDSSLGAVVYAGGTIANDTFRWYRNDTLLATNIGDSTYKITKGGKYRVTITNTIANKLSLYSDTISLYPMPINSISLQAKESNGQVQIQWETRDEIRTSSFAIEHSTDGITFTDIGNTYAMGSGDNRYNYWDKAPSDGINYYRLKVTNQDGSSFYSEVVIVNIGNKQSFSIIPNPARDFAIISFNKVVDKAKILAYDCTGKEVITQSLSGSTNAYKLNTQFLSNGVYLLKVITKTGSYNQKLMISK